MQGVEFVQHRAIRDIELVGEFGRSHGLVGTPQELEDALGGDRLDVPPALVALAIIVLGHTTPYESKYNSLFSRV